MAKAINTALGIDLGQHNLKGVLLQRKGAGRIHVSSYALRAIGPGPHPADKLAHHLKLLAQEVGGSPKACAVAVSSPRALVRIIEQPPTPPHLLRDALKFNDLTLLNQDCKEMILDCDYVIPAADPAPTNEDGTAAAPPKSLKYIVGGLPREEVNRVHAAFEGLRVPATRLTLAPLSSFNAFEFAKPDLFAGGAFMLVDIGHEETVVIVGCKRELALVRSIDYGGRHFVDAVSGDGAVDRQAAITLIEKGDPGLNDAGLASLGPLAEQLRSSIGFFEGQREEFINRVHVCGALVRADLPLQILSDALDIPCELWDPFERCENSLPRNKRNHFQIDQHQLNVAAGAALEMLRVGA